jgi:hypothetical protein
MKKKQRSRRNSTAVVVVQDSIGANHTLRTYYGSTAARLAGRDVRKIRKLAKRESGGHYFAGAKAGVALLKNRKLRSRRNPWDVAVAWTGKKAGYVSPVGNFGKTGWSELAMHTGGAGKHVVRFALWRRPSKGYSGPVNRVTWAQVEYSDGKILDGLPAEVLPEGVRQLIGYSSPVMPNRKMKLRLWALGKGVAANRSRKNSYAIAYAKVVSGGKAVARVEPYLYKDKKLAGVVARHHQYSGVAHIPGAPDSGNLMVNRKRSRYGKEMSEKLRGLALALRHGHEKRRKGSRKNAPNLSTTRHAAATWKAGEAAHKFLSHMDGRNLSLFRDVSMWDFMMGNQKATTARKACAGTVLDRYNEFINVVNRLWPQIQKKEISKAPLRIAAGSWGMMEQMRSDF